MGCDIHMFAEVRKNGVWEKVGKVFEDENYKGEKYLTEEPYEGRNYDLFAILANVRNGYGFAGIKTGEGFNPISKPKGVPKDASPEYLKEVESWEGDGHSHSFFTVKELLEYDWGQFTMQQGCVSKEQFLKYKETGELPNSYCGSISGADVVLIDENEVEGNESYTHVLMRWTESYKDVSPNFHNSTIPQLQKLGSNEDVRIVFFFDN